MIKLITTPLLIIAVALLTTTTSLAQVVINEYSCANLSSYIDNHSDYEDWVELYNPSNTAINLTGYYLSDNTKKPTKWAIPANVTIAANGFVTFWCSGRNEVLGTDYHTNFKISQTVSNPDKLALSNPQGVITDSSVNMVTKAEHSVGRTTNGASTWGIFPTSTKGNSNNTVTPITYAAKAVFSLAPGFYTGTQTVTITTPQPNAVIRYTLNGNDPTAASPIYSTPINIATTKVLKATVFTTTANVQPSFINFATFFINVNHTLPVISASGTDVNTLLNGNNQIKPNGALEFFGTDKLLKTKSYGSYNKHGQDSWICDQRSCDFVARDEMGYSKQLKYPFFDTSPRTDFQRIIIRASGDDNYPCGHNTSNEGSAHMRDGYIQNLADRGNLHLDVRKSTRCIMYVNGVYWGVYEIRERPDDHDYTKYYYKQDKFNLQYVLTWGSTWAEYGGQQAIDDWNDIKNYILTNNMADASKYAHVDSVFNIKSLVDYYIVNSYTVCSDWLNYNTGVWRGTDTTGKHKKWGYLLWDNDATFAFYINYTGIPDTSATALPCDAETSPTIDDPESHMAMLNQLNQNPDFHQYYISRQADLLNTVFSCDNMLSYLDSYTALIDPEMTRHSTRWNGTYAEWQSNVQRLRYFIERRCASIQNTGMTQCYNLSGPYDVTLKSNLANAGTIKINSLQIDTLPWHGKYYEGVTTTLLAQPKVGYTFDNWTATNAIAPNNTTAAVDINIKSDDTITAHFLSTNPLLLPQLNTGQIEVNVYPTIFTNNLMVDYTVTKNETVIIELYDAQGKKVPSAQNINTATKAGQHTLSFDFSKSQLKPGNYLVKFSTATFAKTFKVVYLQN